MKRVELLNPNHERSSFDCGSVALNKFLQQTARQHIDKGISRTFVLVETEEPQTIIGFFSLSLCVVRAEKLPPRWKKKYPSQVPGVKLARLAVAREFQRQGIGGILLIEAMTKTCMIADSAGVIGLFVDAKDKDARSYYTRYGFFSLQDNPLELFLPLNTVKQLLNYSQETSQ